MASWELGEIQNYQELHWPQYQFYPKQLEIMESVALNTETVVVAGNKLGKDYAAGNICLTFFDAPYLFFPYQKWEAIEARRDSRPEWEVHTRRIVTTSVDGSQLRNLWGEIGRFANTSKVPFLASKGGPLVINQQDISLAAERGVSKEPLNYLIGRVSSTGEGISGAHAEYNLMVIDEASGAADSIYEFAQGWAKKFLIFGNPNPCSNFFRRMVEGGDIPGIRKVIHISAYDSPNVQAGMQIFPGVITKEELDLRLKTWDQVRICIGIEGRFYTGAAVLMFPPDLLNRMEHLAAQKRKRNGKAMGVDTGEGGDPTCWAIGDEEGLIHLEEMPTPDTSVIPGKTIALARQYGVPPENIVFDRGGGGYEHACTLRAQGWDVRTVGFGEAVQPPLQRSRMVFHDRLDAKEERYAYLNRRAQMYHALSLQMKGPGWAIPREYQELRRQLAILPLQYDPEGRIYLPPKDKPSPTYKGQTIKQMLGRSPDQADAVVLCGHGLFERDRRPVLEVFG